MKAFHYINFGLIFLFLIGICVLEEVLVSNSLVAVLDDCYRIEQQIEVDNNLNTSRVSIMVDNLEYKWSKNESKLCYMVNHKSIQEIGQEISKMKAYVTNNDIDAFKVSIDTIKFYCGAYMHFMGASVHNIL